MRQRAGAAVCCISLFSIAEKILFSCYIKRMTEIRIDTIIVVIQSLYDCCTKDMRENRVNSYEKSNAEQGKNVLQMIGECQHLMAYIEEVYRFDRVHLKMLRNILCGMEYMEKEEIEREVYQYGSLIKGDDLLERQIFLWLLGMIEAQRV